MDYLLMAAAVCVIIALIVWYIKYFNKKNQKTTRQKNLQPVKCPLCDSNLYVGENIISKVYRPMNVPDQLMVIMGCPHCYPRCEPGLKRICPVCHKEVGPDQSLTARLFNKALLERRPSLDSNALYSGIFNKTAVMHNGLVIFNI